MREERFIRCPEYVFPPSSAMIIGVGGVGSWIALFLAIAGVREIYVVDGDVVEEHNLSRTAFPEYLVGLKKVEALETLMSMIRPSTKLYVIDRNIVDAREMPLPTKIVIDSTDNPELHRKLEKRALTEGFNLIRANYDFYPEKREFQTTNTFNLEVEETEWGEREERRGYRENRSYITPAVLSAIIATDIVLKMGVFSSKRTLIKGYVYPNIFQQGVKVEKII